QGFRLAYLVGAGLVAAAAVVTFTLVGKAAPVGARRLTRVAIAAAGAVAIGAVVGADLGIGGSPAPPIGAYTTQGAYSFVSAPGVHPPVIRAQVAPRNPSTLGPGYILLG